MKTAVFVKGCEYKGIVVLLKERKLLRENFKIIGVGCEGQIDVKRVEESFDISKIGIEQYADKCLSCDLHNTPEYDIFIGDEVENKVHQDRYKRTNDFYDNLSPDELWNFWRDAFERCVRCYACRQVCPVCYCKDCISYENVPQWIDLSPTMVNNTVFHLRRAMCVAGRCINCGECDRVCPVDIPLTLIYNHLAKITEELYEYRAGIDLDRDILLLSYDKEDKEDFIL